MRQKIAIGVVQAFAFHCQNHVIVKEGDTLRMKNRETGGNNGNSKI
jgi:hypothetical protein